MSGFLANFYLPHVSRQSANNKSDNEMKSGTVYRFPGIYLTTEKTSPRRPSDEDCVISHSLKWGPLPPNDVGSHNSSGREKEGKKERMGKRSYP